MVIRGARAAMDRLVLVRLLDDLGLVHERGLSSARWPSFDGGLAEAAVTSRSIPGPTGARP